MTLLEVVLEQSVQRLQVETSQGLLGVLPRHVDCVVRVLPGLLTLVGDVAGTLTHLAVGQGILVKCGPRVTVSTGEALQGDLTSLLSELEARRQRRKERVAQTRSVLSRLEANFVRRFLELSQ